MARSIGTKGGGMSHNDLRTALQKFQVTLGNVCLNSAGLAIGTGSKKKVKIANTTYTLHDGVLAAKTTAEVTLTTANNVANAKFAVIVLSIDSSGTVTPTNSADAASLGAVVFPAVPSGNTVIGFVIINPTGTGGFVGGTTDLDDATVVPNAVYVNTPFPFNLAEQSL